VEPLAPAFIPAYLADRGLRVETQIVIQRTPSEVFDYVTTAALWHTWHPATTAVHDVPNRPLTTGETMREQIAVAGRHDEALWTVVTCEPPRRWEIVTDTANGTAHIVYLFSDSATGCLFCRQLMFRSKRWPWRHLDLLLTRWILVRNSSQALRQLKAVLERG
jgi:uncharacterized protein YndB with AHSA1/START domain